MGKKKKNKKVKPAAEVIETPDLDAIAAVEDFKTRQANDEKLRPCKLCARSNEPCTECQLGFSISPSSYGCKFFINDEDMLLEIAQKKLEEQRAIKTKLYFKMDVMGYLIDAAAAVLEHVSDDIDRDYKAIKFKTPEDDATYAESKKNRDYLRKGYQGMRFGLMDARNAYNGYVQKYFDSLFSQKDGKYNFVEYDKHGYNVGFISAFVHIFLEKTLFSKENAEKILNFMNELEGLDILNDIDLKRLLVKL